MEFQGRRNAGKLSSLCSHRDNNEGVSENGNFQSSSWSSVRHLSRPVVTLSLCTTYQFARAIAPAPQFHRRDHDAGGPVLKLYGQPALDFDLWALMTISWSYQPYVFNIANAEKFWAWLTCTFSSAHQVIFTSAMW